jgi:uncharacterized caspase-like protein
MRTRIVFLITVFLVCGSSLDRALADKRVALVIGNASYNHAPKLTNPENDAAAMSLLLKKAGFDVVEMHQNLSGADLRRSMREFSGTTKDADIAVVFYAGHGIEVGGINYLIPVDAALRKDIDIEDEAVSLDRVLTLLEPAKRLRLIILDACRDNPFTSTMTRTIASRSVGRGLGKVEPPGSDTLIAYAARAGSTSADGDGVNSPFTAALLRNITTPGLDIRLALGRVHDDVMSNTDKKQEPFVYGALGGATISLASLTAEPRNENGSASSPSGDPDAPASRDYEAAAKVGTKEAWDTFLTKHQTGFYADLAKVQRAKIIANAPPLPITTTKQKPASKADIPSGQTSTKRTGDKSEKMTDRQMLSAMQSPEGSRSWCAAHRVWLDRTARAGKMGTIAPTFPALFRQKCGG